MQTKNKEQIKKELKNLKELNKCADEFNMVGDPTRLKICYLLCRHKELAVGEISDIVGVSISAISHTLKKLREASIVESRRDFRNVFYQLKKSSFVNHLKEHIQSL